MTRLDSECVASTAARHCLPSLERMCGGMFSFLTWVNVIEEIRDTLHAACERYDESDSHQVYETEFLPLFDALSYIQLSLKVPARASIYLYFARKELAKLEPHASGSV